MIKERKAPSLGATFYRAAEIRLADLEAREVEFIASNEEVDRYGDIIRADGWSLDNFQKNPVLLFGHKSRELPIGKVSRIVREGTQLIARASFAPKEIYDFADTVFKMVKAGFINAVSVGFQPTKMPNEIKDPNTNAWTGGYEWVGQELLELSVVPVPALPSALAVARSFGVPEEHVLRVMPAAADAPAPSVEAFHAARQREVALASLRSNINL